MPKPPGVYVSALICERILRELNDVVSAIRIADIFNVAKPPNIEPALEKKIVSMVEAYALVTFKSATPQEFTAKVAIVVPGEKNTRLSGQEYPIRLNGGAHGHSLLVQLFFAPEKEGLYWFTVTIDDEVVQQLPLQVNFTPPLTLPAEQQTLNLNADADAGPAH